MSNILQFEQPIDQADIASDGHKQVDPVVTHSDGTPVVVSTNVPSPIENGHAYVLSEVKPLPAAFYDDFLSTAAKEWLPSPIRGLFPLEARPGLISFLAGKPNSTTFPLTSFSFTARSPSDPSQDVAVQVSGQDLEAALQYGPTAGYSPLVEWLYGLQEVSHGRKKNEGWRLSIGSGSQDLLYKTIMCMLNDGDTILVESPTYAGVIPILHTLHSKMIEVSTDGDGISSQSLRETLENWPQDQPKPKTLYTVPYGGNPTGMTHTVARRKEVLALAREHNFLILEDDPYYYVYYGTAPRAPSYFSLERQLGGEVGRVLRFDSLSKVMSAGMRVGFLSGPEPIVQAVDLYTATANLQPSSLSLVIAHSLFTSWGSYDAFFANSRLVSDFYKEKRDVFDGAMQRHLAGLAEWKKPEAGMFFWFKLLTGTEDSESLIRTKALEHGVLALPGTVFLPGGGKTGYVRAAFSIPTEEQVNEGLRRLAEVVREARKEAGVGK